jgi:hypothetical protein
MILRYPARELPQQRDEHFPVAVVRDVDAWRVLIE